MYGPVVERLEVGVKKQTRTIAIRGSDGVTDIMDHEHPSIRIHVGADSKMSWIADLSVTIRISDFKSETIRMSTLRSTALNGPS